MFRIDVISQDSGPSFSREFDVAGDRDNGFGKAVDDYEKGVASVRRREPRDHVY